MQMQIQIPTTWHRPPVISLAIVEFNGWISRRPFNSLGLKKIRQTIQFNCCLSDRTQETRNRIKQLAWRGFELLPRGFITQMGSDPDLFMYLCLGEKLFACTTSADAEKTRTVDLFLEKLGV